jgi:hypothetical protein
MFPTVKTDECCPLRPRVLWNKPQHSVRTRTAWMAVGRVTDAPYCISVSDSSSRRLSQPTVLRSINRNTLRAACGISLSERTSSKNQFGTGDEFGRSIVLRYFFRLTGGCPSLCGDPWNTRSPSNTSHFTIRKMLPKVPLQRRPMTRAKPSDYTAFPLTKRALRHFKLRGCDSLRISICYPDLLELNARHCCSPSFPSRVSG